MEESRGSASSPATGMAVGKSCEEYLYTSIFGVDGPQHDSEARSEHWIPKDKKYFDPLGPNHHGEDHVTGMAEKHEAIAHEAVRDPSEEWFSILGVDGPQHDSEARSEHRIPKVPAKFREYEKDKKYFDPRVVSLGPYHHDNRDDLKPMENHKITAAKQFVEELKDRTVGRRRIYEEFMKVIGVAKGCYAAEFVAHLTNAVFSRMMFLDGCFVLHFIDKITDGGRNNLEISKDLIPLIIRDMFLIENQLPFEVLDALMNLRWGPSSRGKENILHFIIWEVLSPMGFRLGTSFQISVWIRATKHDRLLHLLDILRSILLGSLPSNGAKTRPDRRPNFGSVTELKEIGIRFEKRYMQSSMDISFEEHLLFPRLLLPPMYINDTTISQLLNLKAFESCSEKYCGCGVTSYLHFMDILINDDADVKTLRSKGILHHSLGSDDEVARLFNTWPADERNDLKLFSDISNDIDRHRKRTVKIFIATWVDKYFGSPWTAISIVAASLLLVFTAIQTYFAAFPRR